MKPTTTTATARREAISGGDHAAPSGSEAIVDPVLRLQTPRTRGARGATTTIALLVAMLGLVVVLTRPSGFGPGTPELDSSEAEVGAASVLAGASVRVAPGQSIQAAIDGAGPGATIVIGSGVHTGQSIVPLGDMVITGEAGTVLDGTGAPLPYAIYGDAANVTISHLEIRNYTKPIWGANNYRHQGAIHGAMMNGGGGFIAIARNWRIENNNIHNNAGWGVSPGDGFTVVQNVLHHNGMAGIGGGDFNGGLIEKNDIYANNDPSNSNGDFNYSTGRPWAWAWNAAGIKVANVNCRSLDRTGACSSGTPLIIRSNNVHDNNGVGIWCDINCNDVTIEKNLVERNIGVDSIGIFYEISQNGRIQDNVVRSQGASGNYLTPAGILVWSSDGVVVQRNQVEGTANAIVGNARPREFNRTLRNLTVRDNVILTQGRSTRVGIASDSASDFKSAGNSFNNNYYDNPSQMTFWWTDISRGDSSLTLDQWRSLGFTPASAPPASPPIPTIPVPSAPTPAPTAPTTPTTTTTTTAPRQTTSTTTAPQPTTSSTTTPRQTTSSTTTPVATTAVDGKRAAPSSTIGPQPVPTSTSTTSAPVSSSPNLPGGDAGLSTPPAAPTESGTPAGSGTPAAGSTSTPNGQSSETLAPSGSESTAAPATAAANNGTTVETAPATTTPVEIAPVDTAPEALALSLDDPAAPDDPADIGGDADTSADNNADADDGSQDSTQTAPDSDPEAAPQVDQRSLAFDVTITDVPPAQSSAMLRLLSMVGLAVAAIAIWLVGRSLTRLAKPTTDQTVS